MIKTLIKACLYLFLLCSLIWGGFWLYRQYELRNFDYKEALKSGRIIKIRDNLYSVYNVKQYPVLLMSKDNGKTWYEQNVRGVWEVFPLVEFLQANSPTVDVISMDNTLYLIKKIKHESWDNTSGFYFTYKSRDEGRSWQSCFSLRPTYFLTGFSDKRSNQYFYYDMKTDTFIDLKQDAAEIIPWSDLAE